MAAILKYIGKGAWMEMEEIDILPTDKVKSLVVSNSGIEGKLDLFFARISEDIEKCGYRTTKVSIIMKGFGIAKRSDKNIEFVKSELKGRGFYTLPEYSIALKPDETLRIYNYPVRQLGELFKTEKQLEDYVAKGEHFRQLDIKSVIRQHSPKGSKDKLDFKGEAVNSDIVVLELKNGGGGKSAVEQVLRYAGLLQMEYPQSNIRQILVTGIQNYETALAIRGMHIQQRECFEWYLYKYDSISDHFEFSRVTESEIYHQIVKV